jgi:hypothetical protein
MDKNGSPNNFEIKCNSCSKVYKGSCSDLDWEYSSNERQMGYQNCSIGTWEEVCECGNRMDVIFNFWEYPVGDEDCEIKATGAEVIESCTKESPFQDDNPMMYK